MPVDISNCVGSGQVLSDIDKKLPLSVFTQNKNRLRIINGKTESCSIYRRCYEEIRDGLSSKFMLIKNSHFLFTFVHCGKAQLHQSDLTSSSVDLCASYDNTTQTWRSSCNIIYKCATQTHTHTRATFISSPHSS